MSDVTFLIPGLIADSAWATQAPRTPSVERIVSRGDATNSGASDIDQWLLQQFSVPDAGTLPIAPYSMLGDRLEPGGDYWLCADPVNLSIQRDTCVLTPAQLLELKDEETRALVAALNQHFHDDGLLFRPGSNERWYVKSDRPVAMTTCSLRQVSGRSVTAFQPSGQDAKQWLRIANEAQMLLHSHPVNAAREARGARTANGLWLWGGGVVHTLASQFDCVVSDDAWARGLAIASNRRWQSVAEPIDYRHAKLLVVDRSLESARLSGDASAWRAGMENIESQLIAPAIAALRAGKLTHIGLLTDAGTGLYQWRLARLHLWRIWRGRRALAERQ